MLRILRSIGFIQKRSFRNFGHKRQPTPLPTIIWHGFLTFTFIGLGLEWDVISRLIFGSKDYDKEIEDEFKKLIETKIDEVTVD